MGQIYQIVDNGFNMCYIGSTIDKLSNRFNSHKSKYKKYRQYGIGTNTTVYRLFDEYGVENCKILRIEKYPCDSLADLLAREGEIQKERDCVNKMIMGRTNTQWRQDNKEQIIAREKIWRDNNQEHIKQYRKEYNERNREHIIEKGKIYRENHKDIINERHKEYRVNNKETIRAKEKEPYNCKCGATIQKTEKARHNKTQKHQDWLKQQEEL